LNGSAVGKRIGARPIGRNHFARFYRRTALGFPLAEIVFVGGSLIPHGGTKHFRTGGRRKSDRHRILHDQFCGGDQRIYGQRSARAIAGNRRNDNRRRTCRRFRRAFSSAEKRKTLAENALAVMEEKRRRDGKNAGIFKVRFAGSQQAMIYIFYTLAAVLVFFSYKSLRGGINYLDFFRRELAAPKSDFHAVRFRHRAVPRR
jgi:hypothetical protein